MPFSEKTASIGISLDVPSKKETIIIGSPEDVKQYYITGILSESADLRTQKLSTLVDKMNELAQAADGDKIASVIKAEPIPTPSSIVSNHTVLPRLKIVLMLRITRITGQFYRNIA